MIVEYTRKAVEGIRGAMASRTRAPWYVTVAADLQLEPIRNRDRPKIAFPKGLQLRSRGR